jgi:hypothetical protein
MTNNKKLGLFFIISPWVILLILSLLFILFGLFGWKIINHFLPPPPPIISDISFETIGETPQEIAASIIYFGLILLGILDILYIIIGLIIGIVFFKKSSKPIEVSRIILKTKYKKRGLFLLASPWVILVVTIILFILFGYWNQYAYSHYTSIPFILTLFTNGLVFIGILDIIYIFIGSGLGIYFLKRGK